MAYLSYMTITGEAQGLISKGCSAQDSIGNKCQLAHVDQIQVLAMDHEMLNVGTSTYAIHGPVTVSKNIDKSSPLLGQALDRREKLRCVLDLYRVSTSGTHEKFYTVEYKDAVLVRIGTSVPHSVLDNDLEPEERVSISYRDILWTHHLAKTSGWASWEGDQ